jgi:hypothetical protein
LTQLQEGVYEVRHFTGHLRVVVVHQLPQQEHNAMLHLFSARAELLRYGAEHYRQRSEETSTLLLQLFNKYRLEGMTMPDLLEKLTRETIDELLRSLSAEERVKGLPAEERVKGLSPDELLAALSPEVQEALAQRLRDKGSTSKPD